MLTFTTSSDHLMSITWALDDGIITDLNDFIRSAAFTEKAVPLSCTYAITGERNVSLLEWRSLLISITPLMERGILMKFVCTKKKIYDRMIYLGFSLLGEVICQG